MENNRNPGLVAVAGGVALGVLFALLGVTRVLDGRLGFGLAAACVVVSALLYIFYTRGTPISRTGYGALIFIIAVGLVIPFLMVNQQQAQADQAKQQYYTTLDTGASVFGQYCATCHGFQGQGMNAPQLNNNPTVNKMTDDDITRIISGGIPGDASHPTKLAMPAWLDTFGGSLTEQDISYMLTFIRSSDPSWRATKNVPYPNLNGFTLVLSTLSNPTQIAEFHQEAKGGSKPTPADFKDMTGKPNVALQIVDTPGGAANWGFSPQDVIVSVGAKVTWTNVSTAPHTVTTRPGMTSPEKLDSGIINAGNGTFSFTFTKPGEYPYYCSIHPAMLGWITVK